MNGNKLAVAQAKEIQRLTAEVQKLNFIVSMATGNVQELQKLELINDELAAENAVLLGRIHELGDPMMGPLYLELKYRKHTGRLCCLMSAQGYQQAARDLKAMLADVAHPNFYDFGMDAANKLMELGEQMKAANHG